MRIPLEIVGQLVGELQNVRPDSREECHEEPKSNIRKLEGESGEGVIKMKSHQL